MLGYTPDELEGEAALDIIHPEDQPTWASGSRRSCAASASRNGSRCAPAIATAPTSGRTSRSRSCATARATQLRDSDARGHHRAQARRGGAAPARGALRVPGAPRRADRAAEPRALPRPHPAGAAHRRARRRPARRPADRPRPLQGDQRHARPRLRRPRPEGRRDSACTTALRASDTVARLGGDEFGLLLPKQTEPPRSCTCCEKLAAAIEEPIDLDGLPLGDRVLDRRRVLPGSRPRRRGAHAARRRRDVRAQAGRAGRTPSTSSAGDHTTRRGSRSSASCAARSSERAARPLLPAEGRRSRTARSTRSRRSCAGTTRSAA